MKEAYCSYGIAKLLKEKGFDEPCYMSYAFWEFVEDGFAKHNENIKKLETINEHNDKT